MTVPRGPEYELQIVVGLLLRASAALKELSGDPLRLHLDTVPATSPKPYLTIGEGATAGDVTTFDIHIWADTFGAVRQIESVVHFLLHRTPPALESWRCLSLLHTSSHGPMRDPDGVTKHTVMTFTAYLTSAIH